MVEIRVSKIVLFPIKSLDGISVNAAAVLPSGALEHDREFALYDDADRWINGKSEARLNNIRATYDLANLAVTLTSPASPEARTFDLVGNLAVLEEWFSDTLAKAVHIKRDTHSGFPDDSHAQGPTVISSGTIAEMSSWYALSDLDETRRRFRANVEVSADTAFWEDRLFGKRGDDVGFSLGDVHLYGVGPCKRCVVPVRDSITGQPTPDFEKRFIAKRLETLPDWSTRARFGPLYYRVAVNTRLDMSEGGKHVNVGDQLRLDDKVGVNP
ncbi:MAG: MOSC N-terminal beta barrel domain-containing protein [Acidobacteria bacterium]|nr:MOSC N-terminal beta barrel domain-containing protein [Acidobacteriota bacterium]MBV9477421.1 MOSC N-terminal beta barrel domain-containing protein [Acidobacteriota bacterium]